MKPRSRLLTQCAAAAVSAIVSAFLLLTFLHAGLLTPGARAFDLGVQAVIHRWTSPTLTAVMRTLTLIGSTEFFVPILIFAVLVILRIGVKEQGHRLVRKREVSGIFALGVGGAIALNDSFKAWFHRLRPAPPWAMAHESTYSFPSGHSLFALTLYGLIAYMILDRRTRGTRRVLVIVLAAVMAFGIGISRIYLGVHWPTDVLAGYITASLWLSAVIYIDRRWRTHWQRSLRRP